MSYCVEHDHLQKKQTRRGQRIAIRQFDGSHRKMAHSQEQPCEQDARRYNFGHSRVQRSRRAQCGNRRCPCKTFGMWSLLSCWARFILRSQSFHCCWRFRRVMQPPRGRLPGSRLSLPARGKSRVARDLARGCTRQRHGSVVGARCRIHRQRQHAQALVGASLIRHFIGVPRRFECGQGRVEVCQIGRDRRHGRGNRRRAGYCRNGFHFARRFPDPLVDMVAG